MWILVNQCTTILNNKMNEIVQSKQLQYHVNHPSLLDQVKLECVTLLMAWHITVAILYNSL